MNLTSLSHSSHFHNNELIQIEDWLTKGKISTERLMYLVNDILDLSYLDAGNIQILNDQFKLEAIRDELFH